MSPSSPCTRRKEPNSCKFPFTRENKIESPRREDCFPIQRTSFGPLTKFVTLNCNSVRFNQLGDRRNKNDGHTSFWVSFAQIWCGNTAVFYLVSSVCQNVSPESSPCKVCALLSPSADSGLPLYHPRKEGCIHGSRCRNLQCVLLESQK